MAHKTLIDGTAYEIDGGKAKVDGTVYEIDKGTTLVDGTAYEVGFAPLMLTLTFVNTNTYSCEVNHSELGHLSLSLSLTYEVSPESVLTFNFENQSDDSIEEEIRVNGVYVASKKLYEGKTWSYAYTVTKNATITINCPKYDDGTVTIVEE